MRPEIYRQHVYVPIFTVLRVHSLNQDAHYGGFHDREVAYWHTKFSEILPRELPLSTRIN